MKRINQAGGIVLNGSGQVLMVQALSHMWTFPKGSLDEKEDLVSAAKREIREETGVTKLEMVKQLGSYDRPGFTKENLETPSVIKHITFFLFRTDQQELVVEDDGTLTAEWVNIDEVIDRLSHEQDKNFFAVHSKSLQ